MSTSVVIHIGLHKTGTRFLQRLVFGQLDQQRFQFNPPDIWVPLRRALRRPEDTLKRQAALRAAAQWRESGSERTLVLSEPHASGDMYSMHEGFESNAALLREVFPEARIIYFVRNQAAWLQSAYRQSLVKDKGQPIERFLNFHHGEFHPRPARRVAGNRNVEALNHRFLAIYQAYADAFGGERVYLFRQEDLRRRPDAVNERVAEVLGIERLPEPPHTRSQNRSFSALAIHLFFPGAWRPAAPPDPKRAGEGNGWLHARLRSLRKLRTNFIKHVFDRLWYVDWDLLERNDLRTRIDAHYRGEQEELARIAETILDNGPEGVRRGRDPAGAPRMRG